MQVLHCSRWHLQHACLMKGTYIPAHSVRGANPRIVKQLREQLRVRDLVNW